jgi:hypothetical protein
MLIDKTKFASDHGVKASTISGWMQRHWTKGQHYYVIGRTTMIDTEEFDGWIRNSQQESERKIMDWKSESLVVERSSIKKPLRPTHIKMLTLGA